MDIEGLCRGDVGVRGYKVISRVQGFQKKGVLRGVK